MRKTRMVPAIQQAGAGLLLLSILTPAFAAPTTTNVALFKPTTVSSYNSTSTNGAKAVDGNSGTYWQTKNRSTLFAEEITIDLGVAESISRVVLKWNSSYATQYNIEVSTNNLSYTKVYTVSGEDGSMDTIDFTATSARYVRLYTRAWKNNRDRIRLNEMEVYRDDGLTPPPVAGGWSVVSSPSNTYVTDLRDVTVIDANNIWAVGYGTGGTLLPTTMIQQWNGSQWSIVPSPNPSANGDELFGVAAISSTDAWAVGVANNRANTTLKRSLVLRWDGTTWFEVAGPDVEGRGDILRSVAAISATSAWAVGGAPATSGFSKPLIARWDGNSWSVVPNPARFDTSDGELTDVAAINENNVWAVGYELNVVNNIFVQVPLAMHWDGSNWTVASLPKLSNDGLGATSFNSVSGVAANDLWAVGFVGASNMSMHFDGSKWSLVSSPNNLEFPVNELKGVTAVSPNDVWAVGQAYRSSVNAAGSPIYYYRTISVHWNGNAWSLVTTPNSGTHLNGVANVNTNDVWAVGNTGDSYNNPKSFVLHYTSQ